LVSYYLFPRKIVKFDERNSNPYYDSITHVAVINYWGYDLAGMPVNKKHPNLVLPLKKQP